MPWRGTDCRPTALRRRASRPQLKRDPLGGVRHEMSTSPARRCATPLSAAVLALTLRPVLVSGQALPSAREQLVWHWFGACTGSDSLILEFRVDGKLVYSSAFPICQVRHSDIKPEPQQRLLTFRFDAAPRRFGSQYQASEPEPIIGNRSEEHTSELHHSLTSRMPSSA